jgi:DnaJ-domain-containing protein 1
MSRTAFFTENPLPVYAHLSDDSKRQLEAYLLDGNTAFRQKRLLEFFKTVDWAGLSDDSGALRDERLLQKLQPSLQRQLKREIQDYQNRKAATRVESAEKRHQYRLRVFEYFRAKVPPADKALLESLRDYELDLTGRDVNWRHYFTLDSFKQIDAFIQASSEERQAWIAKFRQDVDTYKKNYDKIHNAQYQQACNHEFTFDDWCDMMGDEAFRGSQKGSQKQANAGSASGGAGRVNGSAGSSSVVIQAHQTLQVPLGATPEDVKRQFRKLTLTHHPDVPSGSEEKMKAIIGAYEEIKRYWQLSEAHAL